MMSKIYKTNQKHLVTIHRPEHPHEYPSEEEDIDENIATEKKAPPWNPINSQFFKDDDSNDSNEDDADADDYNDHDMEVSGSEPDLQWDSSPEQYALQQNQVSDDQELQEILRPR